MSCPHQILYDARHVTTLAKTRFSICLHFRLILDRGTTFYLSAARNLRGGQEYASRDGSVSPVAIAAMSTDMEQTNREKGVVDATLILIRESMNCVIRSRDMGQRLKHAIDVGCVMIAPNSEIEDISVDLPGQVSV